MKSKKRFENDMLYIILTFILEEKHENGPSNRRTCLGVPSDSVNLIEIQIIW